MPASARVLRFEGDRQLRHAFNRLKSSAQRRIAHTAVSKALTPINKAAKQNAKKVRDKGLLQKSIGKKLIPRRRMRKKSLVAGWVGPRPGYRRVIDGKPRNPIKYAHLVELGTDPHVIKPRRKRALKFEGRFARRVQHPGTVAKPFMRPAFDQRSPEAMRRMAIEFRVGLHREALRARKR